MSRILLLLPSIMLIGCASLTCPAEIDYSGLTQKQLAAKVGFPLRVYTLPARAKGGPGILFWTYYQKQEDGRIDEKDFVFTGSPLKVGPVSGGIDPTRFLSLERDPDFQEIYKYNEAHDR